MRLGLVLRLVGEMVANNELLEDTRSLVDTVGGEGRGASRRGLRGLKLAYSPTLNLNRDKAVRRTMCGRACPGTGVGRHFRKQYDSKYATLK